MSTGAVLKAHRAAHHLSQAQLAQILSVDQAYISRLERNDRRGRDIDFRRTIADRLGLSPTLLGLAPEHYRTEHRVEVVEFASDMMRMASTTREAGQSEDAAAALHRLLLRLDAHALEDSRDQPLRLAVAQCRALLGVTLGDILIEEHLTISSDYLHSALKLVADDQNLRADMLRRYGNELRKTGHTADAAETLEEAHRLSPRAYPRGLVAVARARLYAGTGKRDRFQRAIDEAHRALAMIGGATPNFNLTVLREAELRGWLDLGRPAEVARVASPDPHRTPAPWRLSAQWRTIAAITDAQGLLATGQFHDSIECLRAGLFEAHSYHLPRQVHRALRVAAESGCGSQLGTALPSAYDFLVSLQRTPQRWPAPLS